jgi:hypothetical protein
VVSAVLLGREHINLCVSALLGVQQNSIADTFLPLNFGAVETCGFRGEVALAGRVLQDILAANTDNDVLSALVRAVLLGSQRTDLLSSNGPIPHDEFSEVVPAWDFPIVLELLAQSWPEAVPSDAILPSTCDGNGKWGGFSRLMYACVHVWFATGMEPHPVDQHHVGLTTAEKLAVVRKGGRFVAQYDWRYSVRTVDQPIRDRCWRNEQRRRKASKAFSAWYSNNAESEAADSKLSELLSEAGLTYQDYLKASLIAGNRGGVLSKENTCFAVGTSEGPINLTDALTLETAAEEMFFTDGGLGSVASTWIKSFSAEKHELNVTRFSSYDYVTRLQRGPPPGVSGETKIFGTDNEVVRSTDFYRL